MKMARDERVYIRVSTEEKAQIKKLADKDHRSLSDFVRLTVLDKIKEEVKMKKELRINTHPNGRQYALYWDKEIIDVAEFDDTSRLEGWEEQIKEEVEMNYKKYWVLEIKEGLEEIVHQGNNKEIAVEEGKDYWDRLYPEDKKRNKVEVRAISPVDFDEDGEVINYDYSILWESK